MNQRPLPCCSILEAAFLTKCLTWSALWCPPPTLQSPGVRLGMSAQAMQRWATAARSPPWHGTQLKRAPVSYLWCDHPGGRPCPAGAIYCLIYLLRLLPPSNHLLQAPGVFRKVKSGCSVHRRHPDSCTWSRSPTPVFVGGRIFVQWLI